MEHTVIQLSAGSGPRECRRFIPLLADLIRRDAEENGLGLVTLSPPVSPGEDPASVRFVTRSRSRKRSGPAGRARSNGSGRARSDRTIRGKTGS